MCRGALTATVVAAGLVALIAGGSAGAATPKQIYADLVDNNRLDRKYSRADLDRAFPPAVVGYNHPRQTRLPQARPALGPSTLVVDEDGGSSLPFTGLDAALFGAVGCPLLLLGVGLRRFRIHEGKVT